jgi:hypothetical protein
MRCPACAGPVGPGDTHCPGCGCWLAGPQASELRWIEGELARLDAARSVLIGRRGALSAELSRCRATPAPERIAISTVADPPSAAPPAPGPARPELTGRAVARLLLAVGAGLVVIAATAFTIASWAVVGPLGRLAILLAVTGAVLAAPWSLRRRGLYATAEATAAIGCALLTGDAYLARYLLPGSAGSTPLLVAAGIAALACCFAAYGTFARLKGPRLAAIVAAQLPGLILADALAAAVGVDAIVVAALALVLMAAANLVLAGRLGSRGNRAECLAAFVAGVATWSAGVLSALLWLAASVLFPSFNFVWWWWSAAFAVAAADALVFLPRGRLSWLGHVPAADVHGGAFAAVSLAIPAAAAWPAGWTAAAFAAAGALVALAATAAARRRRAGAAPGQDRLRLVAAGSSAVLAIAGITAVPTALAALFPLGTIGAGSWSGSAGLPTAASLAGVAAAPVVLGLVAIAAWRAPGPGVGRPVALAFAGLAAGAIPAAMSLRGWAALAVLTATAAVLMAQSAVRAVAAGDDGRAASSISAAAGCGTAVAAGAVVWSLTGPAATIGELAALGMLFGLAAAGARNATAARVATAGSLAAVAGLAVAVPLASGWPARDTGFAVLAVAAAAITAATLLRRSRPVHALTLDLGAGPLVLLAAALTVRQPGTFAVLTAMAAVLASATAWLREGMRRTVAIGGALCAVLAAVAVTGRVVAVALVTPFAQISRSWSGHAAMDLAAARVPGLGFAVIVLAACAAAIVAAAGAWRGRRGSLDAVAVALPLVAAPAGVASGLGYGLTVGLLLAAALALTAWGAASQGPAPVGSAMITAALAVAWALAVPTATLIVLGCLTAAYPWCAWRSRLATVRACLAGLGVVAAAALAACSVLAAGRPAGQAGLAVVAVAGAAQLVAARASGGTGLVIEVTAWLLLVAGVVPGLSRPLTAAGALAAAGLTCAGVALRTDRRPAIWPGLALGEAAWCVWLAAAGVRAPEPYTVPAALAGLALGWRRSRRSPQARSWLTYGPGLALLLLPSLVATWADHGWPRALGVGVVAAAVTLAGARARLQAPLLIGATVMLLDAGHELAPEVRQLAGTLPGWLPIATVGLVLLWAGATYEAQLRALGRLRRSLATMR